MTVKPADRPVLGIALMLGALFLFVLMDSAIKASVQSLPVLQVLWARFLFHMLIVSAALRLMGRRLPPRTGAARLQVVRSLCLAAANLFFTAALVHVPLAECVAIGFVSPLIVTLLAARMLKERVGWQRWTGILVGFAGVLIILRPGAGVTHPAALFVLVTAAVFAVYSVLTRRLAGIDDAFTTIFHTGVAATGVTSLVVPFVWVWPSAGGWALLALLGMLGGLGHFLLILAYQRAQASVLAPFAYTQMVWATLAGFLLFGELPDAVAVAGAVVVAAGGLFVLWAETRGAAKQA
jgi:drug/metabolite transporter (DMT)-like permease